MTPPACCPPPVVSSSSEPLDRSRGLLNCLAEPRGQPPAPRGTPRSSSDWDQVLALATLHYVAPLLYERLANNTSPVEAPGNVLPSRMHAEENHRWTQINTDSAGQGLGWIRLACGHYPVRRFSTWESLSRSDSHLCLSVSIRG